MFPFDNDKEGGTDAGSMWSGNASLMGQPTPSNNSMLSRAELISIIDEVLDILHDDDGGGDMYHAPSNIPPSVAEEALRTPVRRQTEPHCEDVAQSPQSSSDSSLRSQTTKAKKPRRQ